MRSGLRYAPPFDRTEITAADVVRALERELTPAPKAWTRHSGSALLGSYAALYTGVIAGAADYAAGRATSISGLETPDPHTLVVHLLRPAGDLGYRFSLPATAPIPPSRGKRLGAAAGHDRGYGRALVASGPYMVASGGWIRGRSLTLVRNPSWVPRTDPLRPAYVDRILLVDEPLISSDADFARTGRLVDAGKLDLVIDAGASNAELARPRRGRLFATSADSVYFLAMNLALPPFDDIHVRKAVNLVLDKAAFRRLSGNPLRWSIAGHLAPDGLEAGLLGGYDPYATPGGSGSVAAARTEMAKSRYDRNADGLCDAKACAGVPAIMLSDFNVNAPEMAYETKRDLARIGIRLRVRLLGANEYLRVDGDPNAKVAVAIVGNYAKGYPDASEFFLTSFDRLDRYPPSANASLVGASSGVLARAGYRVTSVPSIHRELTACLPLVGETRTVCWAELDQFLMEKVVPWAPWTFEMNTREVSPRVVRFSFDQLTSLPALDQMAIASSRAP